MHNRFLEEHPRYGRVAYKEILAAFEAAGLTVISEQRRGNVNAMNYAQGIVQQIDSLRQNGIAPNQITIVGTSKGGYIAQYVSTLALDTSLNFVFVASHQEVDLQTLPDINYCGNILTIYEQSDPFGASAIERKRRSSCIIRNFKEIELHTGLGHGFLFRPLPEWIEPSIAWALGEKL